MTNENLTVDTETIKAMQDQIKMLQSLLGAKLTGPNNEKDPVVAFESLSLSPLYLSTGGDGKGEIYSFTEFGEVQNIPLSDAREIVRHNKTFIQEGLVYIQDEDFVAKENLSRYYNKLIDATAMRNLLLCKRTEFGNRYSKLTSTQAETICGMLFEKLSDGKKVDEEILFYISQYSGKDLRAEVTQLRKLIDNEDE